MGIEDISEDFLTREVGIVAAVATVLLAPPVRSALRRAAVSGVAGVLTAGDGIAKLAGRLGRGVERRPASYAFACAFAEEAREERARRAAEGGEAQGEEAPGTAEKGPGVAHARS